MFQKEECALHKWSVQEALFSKYDLPVPPHPVRNTFFLTERASKTARCSDVSVSIMLSAVFAGSVSSILRTFEGTTLVANLNRDSSCMVKI